MGEAAPSGSSSSIFVFGNSMKTTVTPWAGISVAVGAFLTMALAVLASPVGKRLAAPAPEVSVKTLGQKLMTDYVLPLEVMALLLTAAMLGAVIIAMREKEGK